LLRNFSNSVDLKVDDYDIFVVADLQVR